MKKLNKILVLAIIFVLTVSALAGCTKQFDAKEYVEAILDSITAMDYSHLEKLVGENAAEELESSIQEEWDSVIDYANENLGENAGDKFLEIYKGFLKKAKYTVQEAVETEDGYEVDVLIQPIMIFDGVMDRLQTEAAEYYLEEQANLDDDAFMEWTLDKFVEILNEKLENNDITYGEEQTVTLHVNENGGILGEESSKLVPAMFNVELETEE